MVSSSRQHENIHVLLVDHDSEGLIHTAKMLEACRYRVTLVELASAAISMLISGVAEFDFVMANINSPDLHGFKLLQQSVSMGIPIVLMSSEESLYMATRALESGAFLYLNKPVPMDVLKCLWQHSLREKTRMIQERELTVGASAHHRSKMVEIRSNGKNACSFQEHLNNSEPMNNEKMKSKVRDDDSGEHEYESIHRQVKRRSNVKRKMCTEWTEELHAKFLRALEELGEGKCFPKEILELMNEPGLTRMQVASHLQKCRNDDWRPPMERKSQTANVIPPEPIHRPRRFGSKPQLGKIGSASSKGSETQSESNCNVPGSSNEPWPNRGNPSQATFHLRSSYLQQNSGEGSKSPRSSDTSNFESDQSETR